MRPELLPNFNIEEVVLKQFRYGVQQHLDHTCLVNVDIVATMADQLRLRLEATIYGRDIVPSAIKTVTYPDGWWQALKAAILLLVWVPVWFKRHIKVRQKTVEFKAEFVELYPDFRPTCPELGNTIVKLQRFTCTCGGAEND